LEDVVKKEVMKPFETGKIDYMTNSLRVDLSGVTSKTKCFKQPTRQFIKRKRFKWRIKKEKPKSDPEGMCLWFDNCKVAPLRKVNKRSWVEAKVKYPS
ncbi:hypothetical protein A2U01_0061473, partial [Trifolium medium]|nr:hypothetical protein [Trifolium medium]